MFINKRSSGDEAYAMDALLSKVDDIMGGRVAPSTRAAYDAAFKRWEAFAMRFGVDAVPADPRHIACFLAHSGDSVIWDRPKDYCGNQRHASKTMVAITNHASNLAEDDGSIEAEGSPAGTSRANDSNCFA